jgi:uncharacterized protein (TIGR03790 family)
MCLRRGRKLCPRKSTAQWSAAACLVACAALACFASRSPAVSSSTPAPQTIPLNERVLVVYNPNEPESVDVADYYVAKRGIPAANKCAVNTAETYYIADWNAFDAAVRTPVKNCLNAVGRDKILYIVFTYLTPYKVGDPIRAVDQQIADIWDEYASGRDAGGAHPYYAPAQSQGNYYQPFVSLSDYRQQPSAQHLYSVWRLDGPSAALAKGLVDKALLAEANGLTGRGCFDMQGDINQADDYRYGSGDWDIHRGADQVRRAGFEVVEDSNSAEFGTAPAPLRCDNAALYAGWYSLNNYNDAFTWRPGAIGFHTDSASAYNIRYGPNWSRNAVINGITVTSGAVDEPYLEGVAHSDGVFRNLFEGANVGDALLRNTRWLKWMIANIGDPLYRPFPNGLAPFNQADAAEASLSLSPIEVGGGGPASATLKLAAPAPIGGVQVTLASSDYSVASPPASVTIPEGARAAVFSVNTSPVADDLYARITATYPGGVLANTLRVSPNEVPTISISDVTVTEGNTGTTGAVFNVSLSAASAQTVTVKYQTASGTAASPADYTAVPPTTLTFAPGQTSLPVTVQVKGDLLDEPNETFSVNLSAPTNATVADASGLGTITDNDPAPSLRVNRVAVTEVYPGTVNANFTVSLSAKSAQTVTVKCQTTNGTAVAPADYTALPLNTLTFTPGQTSLPVTVSVKGDLLDETNETFNLVLSAPVNATLAVSQGTGTILDSNEAPQLSVNNVTVTEGNSGTLNAVFTVRLSAASGRNVSVKYQTADGTATAGTDYTARALTTLIFYPGQTAKTVTVPVKGDLLDEPDETFKLVLSGPVNATLAVTQGTATITDNDPAP